MAEFPRLSQAMMSHEMYANMVAIAAYQGTSFSAVLRDACARYIREERVPRPAPKPEEETA